MPDGRTTLRNPVQHVVAPPADQRAQGLENSDADLWPHSHKDFLLPRGNRYLKTEMGLLATIGLSGGDDSEDDEVSDDDDSEEETDTRKIAITPESQFLGVRAILFDPQAADPAGFQPILVAGIMGLMSKGPRGGKKKGAGKKTETEFSIRRNVIKKLLKQFGVDAKTGQIITAVVPRAVLNAELTRVFVTPLAEITTEDRVNDFVDRLVAMTEG